MARRKIRYESIIKPNLANIEDLARQGSTDSRIAEVLGIGRGVFMRFKNEYPELLQVLQKGREEFMKSTASALFQRAIGYTEKAEVLRTQMDPDGKVLGYTKEQSTKRIPPDLMAIRMVYTLYDRELQGFEKDLKLLDETRKTIGFERQSGVRVPTSLKADGEWLKAEKRRAKETKAAEKEAADSKADKPSEDQTPPGEGGLSDGE